MPIEIKEMHIKINVDSAQSGGKGGGSSNESAVQECLDQVAKLINDKNER
ncbi:MAG: hypothetical protein ACJA1C_000955 [Crocinitomicaceae bacterium]|jgi:hypothetical protein